MRHFELDDSSYFIDQSLCDAPCRVRFAGRDSLFSIGKWGERASISFAPGDGHRGVVDVRGRELLVKPESTPKTQHVFRRLDGERFEYDVILLKEPETNVIRIELDFPDGLDFYKQPSPEEALAKGFRCRADVMDSYAVYWKMRNGAYKTGKFCHIFRPLIRDARGRTVWGKLSIEGKMMTVTIPEGWLSDATYPVVVDPVIGTQTRGATHKYDEFHDGNEGSIPLECMCGVNYFTAPAPIIGTLTSNIYMYDAYPSTFGRTVVYSDLNGSPNTRISCNEILKCFDRATEGWMDSVFSLSRVIEQGEVFWWGYQIMDALFYYFDYGNCLKVMYREDYSPVPETFSANLEYPVLMSMYFTFADVQHYERSVLDTIGLSEIKGKKSAFSRSCGGNFALHESAKRIGALVRLCGGAAAVSGVDSIRRSLLRKCTDGLNPCAVNGVFRALYRLCVGTFGVQESARRICAWVRSCSGAVFSAGNSLSRIFLYRVCRSVLLKTESLGKYFSFKRQIDTDAVVTGRFSMIQSLIRFCATGLNGVGQINRSVGLVRSVASGIQFFGSLLKRILLKKDELVFVSRITREIEFRGNLV